MTITTPADAAPYLREGEPLRTAEQAAMSMLTEKLWVLHHARDHVRGVVVLLSRAGLLVDREQDARMAAMQRSEIKRLTEVAEGWQGKYQAEIDRHLPPPPNPTIVPDGCSMPKAAAELLACAEEHGWVSLTTWFVRDGAPAVTVQLAHKAADGRAWNFSHLMWGAPSVGESMSLSSRGLQSTPEHQGWHDAPSLKRIRELIAANPA